MGYLVNKYNLFDTSGSIKYPFDELVTPDSYDLGSIESLGFIRALRKFRDKRAGISPTATYTTDFTTVVEGKAYSKIGRSGKPVFLSQKILNKMPINLRIQEVKRYYDYYKGIVAKWKAASNRARGSNRRAVQTASSNYYRWKGEYNRLLELRKQQMAKAQVEAEKKAMKKMVEAEKTIAKAMAAMKPAVPITPTVAPATKVEVKPQVDMTAKVVSAGKVLYESGTYVSPEILKQATNVVIATKDPAKTTVSDIANQALSIYKQQAQTTKTVTVRSVYPQITSKERVSYDPFDTEDYGYVPKEKPKLETKPLSTEVVEKRVPKNIIYLIGAGVIGFVIMTKLKKRKK